MRGGVRQRARGRRQKAVTFLKKERPAWGNQKTLGLSQI
jgi:hypothetical protein